jgi:hypothetical protein
MYFAEVTNDVERTASNLMSKRHQPRTSFEAQKKAMYEENRRCGHRDQLELECGQGVFAGGF